MEWKGLNGLKKIIAGAVLLLGGIALYLPVHLRAADYSLTLGGWTTPPGRFGTALQNTVGEAPTRFAILFMTVGTLLLLWGAWTDDVVRLVRWSQKRANSRPVNGESVKGNDDETSLPSS